MKRIIGLAAAIAISGALTVAAQAQHVLRIGMVTVNDAQHTFAQKYAEELQKRTNDQIKVEVFPAAQLGSIAAPSRKHQAWRPGRIYFAGGLLLRHQEGL